MNKAKNSPEKPKSNPKDDPKEMPEFEKYKVYEALIDRTRDISPKNDKAQ
jgi:hypothetical protein